MYSNAGEQSATDDDENNSYIDRNEIMFLAMEYRHHEEEPNEDNKEDVFVYLEAKLVEALEEIENLREINERKTKEYVVAKGQLFK